MSHTVEIIQNCTFVRQIQKPSFFKPLYALKMRCIRKCYLQDITGDIKQCNAWTSFPHGGSWWDEYPACCKLSEVGAYYIEQVVLHSPDSDVIFLFLYHLSPFNLMVRSNIVSQMWCSTGFLSSHATAAHIGQVHYLVSFKMYWD